MELPNILAYISGIFDGFFKAGLVPLSLLFEYLQKAFGLDLRSEANCDSNSFLSRLVKLLSLFLQIWYLARSTGSLELLYTDQSVRFCFFQAKGYTIHVYVLFHVGSFGLWDMFIHQ